MVDATVPSGARVGLEACRVIERVEGYASVSMWDQAHAEAMSHLRRTGAFVLVTLNEDSTVRFQAVSKDLSPEGLESLLTLTGRQAYESAAGIEDPS